MALVASHCMESHLSIRYSQPYETLQQVHVCYTGPSRLAQVSGSLQYTSWSRPGACIANRPSFGPGLTSSALVILILMVRRFLVYTQSLWSLRLLRQACSSGLQSRWGLSERPRCSFSPLSVEETGLLPNTFCCSLSQSASVPATFIVQTPCSCSQPAP